MTIRNPFARGVRIAAAVFLAALTAPVHDASAGPAARTDDAQVKKALEDEMARSLSKLRLGSDAPPYFLRYAVTDSQQSFIAARLGTVAISIQKVPSRRLVVEVRVGSRDQDNTNFFGSSPIGTATVTPEDEYGVLRRDLWQLTDRQYKLALETLARKKASRAIQTDKDKTADFAAAPNLTSTTDHATQATDADRAKLSETVVKLSALFREQPGVDDGRVYGQIDVSRRRLLTSEKVWTDERRSRVQIVVRAETVAKDGQRVAGSLTFTGPSVAGLPPFAKMEADVRALAKTVADQRTAPVVDAGSASVLFEGPAAPELAWLLFAGPLSGQPIPRSAGERSMDGSTSLADKLGLAVAPKWLDVVDDPKALGPGKRLLFGGYDTDDEGVAAVRTPLIERGVVKTLLMSRAPRKEIAQSNGHGRGLALVRATASNLFVTASGGQSRAELLALAQRSAGPKGTVYIVRELAENSGIGRGQTLQARVAFRVKDGKEELVRGLSLEGFVPKKLKKDLVAAGKEPFVLEDDRGLPVSVVCPALLFEDVDVGRPNEKNRTPPLYPSPLAAGPH